MLQLRWSGGERFHDRALTVALSYEWKWSVGTTDCGHGNRGLATNWTPYIAVYELTISGRKLLHAFISRGGVLNLGDGSTSDEGLLLRFCICSGYTFRRFGWICCLHFYGDCISSGCMLK